MKMTIRLSRKDCAKFLDEMIEDFADASTWYGMHLGSSTPEEELAEEQYEIAWFKVHTAIRYLLNTKEEIQANEQ